MSSAALGPFTRAEFDELVRAPFGGAAKIIRKHDPLWGRAEGEAIKWRVQLVRDATERGWVTVEASSAEEAMNAAEETPSNEIDWEVDSSESFSATSAEPVA